MIIKNKKNEVIFEGDKSDLSGADLTGADLSGADLSDTYLIGADLRGAILTDANLSFADLRNSDLTGADLTGADLTGADLRRTDLWGANLSGADLSGSDLSDADLRVSDLTDADLTNTKLPEYSIVPTGEFTAFKKVYVKDTNTPVILTVRVPENADRMNSLGSRKVRVSECVPLSAETLGGEKVKETEFTNYSYHNELTYKIGEPCFPDSYDPDIRVECSNGVHVFMTKKEAIEF